MKIMPRRNSGDSVNNTVYYSVYYIPSADLSIKNEERLRSFNDPLTAPTIKWCVVIITWPCLHGMSRFPTLYDEQQQPVYTVNSGDSDLFFIIIKSKRNVTVLR